MTRGAALAAVTMRTPWGPVSAAVDLSGEEPTVVASCIGAALGDVLARVGIDAPEVRRGRSEEVSDAVGSWIAGDVDAITRVAVRQPGTAFRQSAWAAMRRIPGGTVVTYAELAAMAGNPRAVRAAGSACAANAVAPFVPCHRIVRTGGSLGNYGYGIDIKQALLIHEGAWS